MDIALRYDPQGGLIDLGIDRGDLATDDGLETAVLLSLYTDRTAEPDDVLPGGGSDRRGWWADAFADRPHGSRLWLLDREKELSSVRRRAEEYAREALAWLIEDGIATAVEISAETQGNDTLFLLVVIRRPNGADLEGRYEYVWQRHSSANDQWGGR